MIRIVRWWDSANLLHDDLPAEINETVGAGGGRAAWVRLAELGGGGALVLYTGAPEGDGVFTGAALDRELEAALRASFEGGKRGRSA